MSLSARRAPEAPVAILRYFDVVVILVAAPVMLLIGVSPLGYAVGGGSWLALRAIGIGAERVTNAADARTQISIRLAYMLGRMFLLAIAVILARRSGGQGAGLAALAVVVVAFTLQLATSALNPPRRK